MGILHVHSPRALTWIPLDSCTRSRGARAKSFTTNAPTVGARARGVSATGASATEASSVLAYALGTSEASGACARSRARRGKVELARGEARERLECNEIRFTRPEERR